MDEQVRAMSNAGISLRDYFAAAALTGLCMRTSTDADKGANATLVAEAFALADSMIEAGEGAR